MASARIVAVVVPSPATVLVFEATSLTNWAPMFSNGSSSSMSSATVTPSLVTFGAPQPLSSTALRPRGPSVLATARDNLEAPSNRLLRASSSKTNIFATASPSIKRLGYHRPDKPAEKVVPKTVTSSALRQAHNSMQVAAGGAIFVPPNPLAATHDLAGGLAVS